MSKPTLNEESRIYWQDRIELHDKKVEKDTLKLEKQLKKLFVDTSKEIKKELAYFYANNTNIGNYENYRLEATLQAINIALDTLFNKEEEKLNERLVEAYTDTYKYFDNLLNVNASFETINTGLVEQVVKTNWSGLSFSERIWENRRKLALTLKEELKKGLIRGESLQEISRIIADKLNNEYSNALRLVRTETAWIQCEATKQNYLDNDIKYYEFSAFLDKKTSKICKELDGKVVKVEEAIVGKNMPPLHPNCRSCMIPITEDLVFKKTKKEVIEEDINASNNIPNDKKGIVNFMQNKLGIKVENVDSIDERLLKGCAEFTYEFLNKYPKLKEHSIYKDKFRISQATLNYYADYHLSRIRLSTKSYGDYSELTESIKRQHKSGWMIKCDEGLEYKQLYAHEFGHFINDLISIDDDKFYTEKKMADEFKKQLIAEYKKTTKEKIKASDIGGLVSDYALTNSFELFAECFAEYYTSSSPRPFAKLFGAKLETYLEKYK